MKILGIYLVFIFLCLSQQPLFAHFGMLIPSNSRVAASGDRTVRLQLAFAHPFAGLGIDLAKPVLMVHRLDSRQEDLSRLQKPVTFMQKRAWQIDYPLTRPGSYWFVMTPQPYWEMTEDCYIIHYTKTLVAAFGDDEGWDKELGIKTEIVPLSNPVTLYQGNVFQGIVKMDGKPVPFAIVEIEYFNRKHNLSVPLDGFSTQTIKTDSSGVFTYAAPLAGWWGFAALNTADYRLEKGGEDKKVELGAVIWVKFQAWWATNSEASG